MKKKTILNEGKLREIVSECVKGILLERQGLKSMKLYNILKQHGGLGNSPRRGRHKTAYGWNYSELTDNDVIGVIDWNQRDGVYNGEIRDKAIEMGYNIGKADELLGCELLDGKYVVVIIRNGRYGQISNEYITPQKGDFIEYLNKCKDRELSRPDWRFEHPTAKGKAARDLRTNPYFWDKKDKERQTNWYNPERRKEVLDYARQGKDAWGNEL